MIRRGELRSFVRSLSRAQKRRFLESVCAGLRECGGEGGKPGPCKTGGATSKEPWQMTPQEWHRNHAPDTNSPNDSIKAHAEIVAKAMKDGKPVPDHAFNEHPELRQQRDAAKVGRPVSLKSGSEDFSHASKLSVGDNVTVDGSAGRVTQIKKQVRKESKLKYPDAPPGDPRSLEYVTVAKPILTVHLQNSWLQTFKKSFQGPHQVAV